MVVEVPFVYEIFHVLLIIVENHVVTFVNDTLICCNVNLSGSQCE
jgi:hypothetical protein